VNPTDLFLFGLIIALVVFGLNILLASSSFMAREQFSDPYFFLKKTGLRGFHWVSRHGGDDADRSRKLSPLGLAALRGDAGDACFGIYSRHRQARRRRQPLDSHCGFIHSTI
jgi:hypothetical protein